MSIRNQMVLLLPCLLFGLLGVSDGYIYVPSSFTNGTFVFSLVDNNGERTYNGSGILLARDYSADGAGKRGAVCDTENRFTDEAAAVICMEMGYTCAENWSLGPADNEALIDNVECENSSLAFRNCRYDRTQGCNRKISLTCDWRCQYEFSLVDSEGRHSKSNSGLLVATKVGTKLKGTVCDDRFDDVAALTICREMGHDCLASWSTMNTWKLQEKRNMRILLDDVSCSERGVLDGFTEGCFWKTQNDCDHSEDVYLSCDCMLDEFKFSIVDSNGKEAENGRGLLIVEKKSGSGNTDKLGTVCDDLFDETSADVICKSMGFACSKSFESAGDKRTTSWSNAQKVVLSEVVCQVGDEGRCTYSTEPYCDHSEDVLIECGSAVQCQELPTAETGKPTGQPTAGTGQTTGQTTGQPTEHF